MRGQGEGSIYQRADGYWVGQIEIGRDEKGNRRRTRRVRRTRAETIDALDKTRSRYLATGVAPDNTTTVADYLAYWIEGVAGNNISADSRNEYRKRLRRVNNEIGGIRLQSLTTPQVQTMVNRLSNDYAPKTVATTLETLRSALRWAVGAELVHRNVAEYAKPPRKTSTTVDDALTSEEAHAVLKASVDHKDEALIWIAITYGIRIGELLNLRWSDVYFDQAELKIRKSKTKAGTRDLPLLPEAEKQLRAHRRRNTMTGRNGLVFPGSTGLRRSQQDARRVWNTLLEAAGIEHRCSKCEMEKDCSTSVRRFHVSRHTAATLLLENGVPLEVVSAILGHANISITADIYAKVRADLMRKRLLAISQ